MFSNNARGGDLRARTEVLGDRLADDYSISDSRSRTLANNARGGAPCAYARDQARMHDMKYFMKYFGTCYRSAGRPSRRRFIAL